MNIFYAKRQSELMAAMSGRRARLTQPARPKRLLRVMFNSVDWFAGLLGDSNLWERRSCIIYEGEKKRERVEWANVAAILNPAAKTAE